MECQHQQCHSDDHEFVGNDAAVNTRTSSRQRGRGGGSVNRSNGRSTPEMAAEIEHSRRAQSMQFLGWLFLRSSPGHKKMHSSHGRRKTTEHIDTSPDSSENHRNRAEHDEHAIHEEHKLQLMALEQQFNNSIQTKTEEWNQKERELRKELRQSQKQIAELKDVMNVKLKTQWEQYAALDQKHTTLIREIQEDSFRRMESARWQPEDESRIKNDLDKLKKDMRSFAKMTSIKDIARLLSLQKSKYTALIEQLSSVVVLENGHLPKGVNTIAKSPMILLNSILSDDVYTSFFKSPFSCLQEFLGNSQSIDGLENIYNTAKITNPEDAHKWRSDTLRLLMPPIRGKTSQREKERRYVMEETIAKVANERAKAFLDGPASSLIDEKVIGGAVDRLQKIYREAATQSCMLWTRRSEMRCHTLRDFLKLEFDAESQYFKPDALMRHDDHEDQMRGRPVTILVHPLLMVAGNEEATAYDQERIWVEGIVWLDSRMT